MRGLSSADALKQPGAKPRFVSRDLPVHSATGQQKKHAVIDMQYYLRLIVSDCLAYEIHPIVFKLLIR
jgi:hypothetical protein